MRIGLIRHFEVSRGYPKERLLTPVKYLQWLHEYDNSTLVSNHVDLGDIPWEKCYCSDIIRSVKTAAEIYHGEIILTPDLREITLLPIFKKNIPLPTIWWILLGRLASMVAHSSQPEGQEDFLSRVKNILDKILSEDAQDILVVSHGGIMMFLRRELLRRGFTGPSFRLPENGKLYVFEK